MDRTFSPIPVAIEALRQGRMIIVVDDEDRENEGDVIVAAEHIDEAKMSLMIRHTSGIIFLAISNQIANQLDLPPMVERNTSQRETPFTVSIEAAEGVTTGVSAKDRTTTIKAAISPVAKPEDLHRPGHIFPLRSKDGGVLVRAGHTEASVDMAKLAGLRAGAVGAELMNDDGSMMRLPEIQQFAATHEMPVISIADLIAYRRQHDVLIRKEAEADLETDTGTWKIVVYSDTIKNQEHVALVKGDVDATKPTLVRVHSECLTGDAFGSHHCDCGKQLDAAMQKISDEGTGVLLYLRQEGRGVGLSNKIKAYAVQQKESLDTVEANHRLGFADDLREYGIGAQILKDVGVHHVRLLTNNPRKIVGLHGYGLHVTEQIPLQEAILTDKQKKYLRAKKEKLGHLLQNL